MSFHKDIAKTADRIQEYINHTFIQYSPYLSKLNSGSVFLKLENTQKTGSFKFRGAYWRCMQLNHEEKNRGVVAFSSGNFAQALPVATSLVGTSAKIVLSLIHI